MVTALPGAPTVTPALPPLPRRKTPWHASQVNGPVASEVTPTAEGIRRHVRNTLTRMANLVDERLPDALRSATWAWEQTGSMALLDDEALELLLLARQDLRYAVLMGEPPVVALATEGLWALRTAFAVISLLETRLPSLIRLRTRMEAMNDRDLLPHGRPFLDLAPALHELARRWA